MFSQPSASKSEDEQLMEQQMLLYSSMPVITYKNPICIVIPPPANPFGITTIRPRSTLNHHNMHNSMRTHNVVKNNYIAEVTANAARAQYRGGHVSQQTETSQSYPSAQSFRIPCMARGLSSDHNKDTAYFEISFNTLHGRMVTCSHPECCKTDREFRYCSVCKRQVAHRNFVHRHGHGILSSLEQLRGLDSNVETESSFDQPSALTPTNFESCPIVAYSTSTFPSSTSHTYKQEKKIDSRNQPLPFKNNDSISSNTRVQPQTEAHQCQSGTIDQPAVMYPEKSPPTIPTDLMNEHNSFSTMAQQQQQQHHHCKASPQEPNNQDSDIMQAALSLQSLQRNILVDPCVTRAIAISSSAISSSSVPVRPTASLVATSTISPTVSAEESEYSRSRKRRSCLSKSNWATGE